MSAKQICLAIAVLFTVATVGASAATHLAPRAKATAAGLGVNLPVVGRVIGGGNTLFVSSLDITNASAGATQVDVYFDGTDSATQQPVLATGSITSSGIVPVGGGTMRGSSNVHFDDFIDALVKANLLSTTTETDGVIGSVLVVFNGLTRSGQGSAAVRFSNAACGGTVGVAMKGHEMTGNEPQKLIVAVRDTRGNTNGAPQLYPNLFINNTGIQANGSGPSGAVTVVVSAVSNRTGQAVGVPLTLTVGPGQTATIGQVPTTLQVPDGTDDTLIVTAQVVSGTASIEGLVSEVDATTKDGSVIEMNRAD